MPGAQGRNLKKPEYATAIPSPGETCAATGLPQRFVTRYPAQSLPGITRAGSMGMISARKGHPKRHKKTACTPFGIRQLSGFVARARLELATLRL